MKKALSLMLVFAMIMSMLPTAAFAAETDNLCAHHIEHTADCGYAPAVEGVPCGHAHDENCGYAEATEEVLCACAETDENGAVVHTEGCGYAAPVPGSDCTHVHDEACGYVEAQDEIPCAYACSESHDEAAPAAECTCAEACTAENFNEYCEVCGVDYTKCTGTDTAVQYAEDASPYAVVDTEAGTLTIDGTFGGKDEVTDANEITALVNTIKSSVDNGITTIIVTGSEMAIYNGGYYDNFPAYAEALYYVTEEDENSKYCGTIDLILPDVAKIGSNEFNAAYSLKSITLPKVTTIENAAFMQCDYLKTLTFGSVLTSINTSSPFTWTGSKVEGGTDLVLNCGQMQTEGNYKPNLETNEWYVDKSDDAYKWNSITLTHTPEADDGDCTTAVKCDVCGETKESHTGSLGTPVLTEDGTQHTATYDCCGATVTEDHTFDSTTGKCECGAEIVQINTVNVTDWTVNGARSITNGVLDGALPTLGLYVENSDEKYQADHEFYEYRAGWKFVDEDSNDTTQMLFNGESFDYIAYSPYWFYFGPSEYYLYNSKTFSVCTDGGYNDAPHTYGDVSTVSGSCYDLLWGKGTSTSAEISPTLQHVLSMLTVNITDLGSEVAGGVTVESVTIGGTVVTGDLDLTGANSAAEVVTVKENEATTDIKAFTLENPHEGYVASYEALIIPQTAAVTITIKMSDGGEFVTTLTQREFQSGYRYNINLPVGCKHEYSYSANDDGNHTGTCSVCGNTVTEEHTCDTEKGQTCQGYFCTVCKNWYGEQNDTHDWSGKDGICARECGTQCAHEAYTDGVCNVCDYVCTHTGGTLDTPVPTEDGKHIATCSCCGAAVTEEHSTGKEGDKAATCKAPAYCSICQREYGNKDADNHIGTLTYSANGNVITKSCSECQGTVGTATITAGDTTYNGTAQETATVAYSEGWASVELTVSYANNTNAGTATASITIGEATASVEFTIAKAEIDIDSLIAPVFAKDLVYNGEPQALVTKTGSIEGGTIVYSLSKDGEYTATIPTATDAGTYRVYWSIEGDENHYFVLDTPGHSDVTIAPKDVSDPVIEGINAQYVHTGSAITPVPTAVKDGNTVIDTSEYTVEYENNINEGTAVVKIVDVAGGNYTVSGSKTFAIVVHAHVWGFTASGDTITATCSGTIGTCPVTENTVTITLNKPNELTYDGSAKTVTVTQSPVDVLENVPAEITGNWINAGTYTAELTYGEATATLDFTIEKAAIGTIAVNVTAPAALADKQTTVDGGTGYTATIAWDTDANTFGFNTAYTATVTLTADSNHKFAEGITVNGWNVQNSESKLTLTKTFAATRKAKLTELTDAPENVELEAYHTNAASAIAELPTSVTYSTESGSVTVDIEWSCENYNSATKAANTFAWTVKAGELDNYDVNSIATTGSITVTNVDAMSVTNSGADQEITYNGETYDVSKMFTKDTNAGAASYAIVEGGTGAGTLDGSVLTITKAGTITIKLTTAANDPYAAGEATATLTVKKAAGSGSVTMEGWTYGEEAKAPVSSGTGTVTYEYSTENGEVPTNAGTYTITATFAATDLYEEATASATFTIAKKSVKVTAEAKSKAYGSDDPTLTYIAEGLVNGDTLTGSLSRTVGENVGAYAITVGTLANSNYTIVDFTSASLTVTPKAIEVKANAASKTYAEADPELTYTATGLVGEDKLSGKLTRAEGENVGTYAIVQGTLTAGDNYTVTYTGAELTINAKAISADDVELNSNLTYNGTEQTQQITVKAGIDYEVTGNKATDVGFYTLTVTASGNYTGSVTKDWSIGKAAATVKTAPTANELTYTGSVQTLVTEGIANGGKLVYSLTENGEYTETIPTGKDAGDYIVWYYVKADENHTDSGKASVKVTIAKAKAKITVDTTTIEVTYGTLVTLPIATTNFGAVVCDKTADDLVNAGTYTVTYTVEGTANYEGDSKTLTVKIGQVVVAEPTVSGTYIYTGTEQTAQLTGVENCMTVVSGDKATNAGSYEVIITLDGNHKWDDGSDGKVQWSIGKAEFGDVYVSLSEMLTYNGTAQTPKVNTDADSEGDQTATFTYRLTDNESYGEMPAFTDAGTYTVYFKASASNHKDATGSFTVTVEKAKAEITVDTTPITATYGETVALPEATTTFGDVTCDMVAADLVNAGTYTVTYSVAGTDNYDGDTKTVSVTINAKVITAGDVELNGTLTYNGKEQTQAISVKDGITYTVTGDKATDAGSYELTVSGTGNYTGDVKLAYTVEKKPISVVWENTNLVYNGSAQSPIAKLAGTVIGDDVQAEVSGSGTNAGTYDAAVSLSGTDAGNYTLTGSTKFTIARAPVTFKVSNNSVEEGKTISVTVISDPAGVAHSVTYRQNGSEVTPSAVGEYEIYVAITNENYRHAASANGAAIKVGVLTIYEGKKPATYTLSYAPGAGTGSMAVEEAAMPGTTRILPEPTFTAPLDSNNNPELFAGWSDGTVTYKAGEKFIQPEKNVTLTAVWVAEEHNISGMVKQFISMDSESLENRGGVVVTLMLGSKQVAQAVTDESGNYKFEHCLLGTYNLVAEYEGIKQTVKAVLGHSDMTGLEIDLPAAKTNTTVNVEPGTPDVVVGGLDGMLKETDDTVFTEEDKQIVEAGGEVEIKMDIKENPAPEKKDELESKAEEVSAVTEIGLFLDLDLTKTVTKADESTGTSTAITEASKLLENIIFLPGHMQGKNVYHVFREHGGQIEELPELTTVPTGTTEGFIVDRVNHTITIYSMKYSTYAIAYTDPFTVTFSANGGTVNVESAQTGTDGTLDSLPTPTRSGYTFKGWFTAESGGTEVTVDTVFNADKIIYAQWQLNYVPTPSSGSTNKVTVDTPKNGSVDADFSSAKEGTTVTITVTPDEGYVLNKLTVTDAKGNELKVTSRGNDRYSFIMPDSKVTIAAGFVLEGADCTGGDGCLSEQFSDLDTSLWYHKATDYVLSKGLMNGVGNGKFDPNGTTSRAMIVTILWRLEGEPVVNYLMQFEDVAAETWYTEAIRWAASEGIVTGYSDLAFGPNDAITREQLATILYRYEQYKGGGFTGAWMFLLDFTDRDKVSDWAYEAMCWTTMHGVINGKGDGILDPKGNAKRCEAAQMLMNYLER